MKVILAIKRGNSPQNGYADNADATLITLIFHSFVVVVRATIRSPYRNARKYSSRIHVDRLDPHYNLLLHQTRFVGWFVVAA
jgi:hypothetical protein